ncbi:MAG: hypothetical protein EPO09_15550, partial [Aquabacterium sp.]|uniref:WD40/YVTN/BNR-like repeat-containing protein n=1 Tax=Aquabacterium sp. TaxID=1872578 RepID=UPI001212BF49
WEKTFTPPNGTIRVEQSLTFTSDTTVVLTSQLGVNRSTDGGLTWQESSIGGSPWSPSAIAFSSANQGFVLSSVSAFPAFSTNDGGLTWTQAYSWPSNFDGTAIAFRSDGVGVAAGDQGRLYRTTDRGSSWTLVTKNLEDPVDMSFGSPAVGVVISDKTLYRTSDAGAHWSPVGAELTPGLGETWRQVSFLDANTVIAIDSTGRIVRSTDGGANWSFASRATVPFPGWIGDMAFSSPKVGWLIVNSRLRHTTDAGMTWEESSSAYSCINHVTFPNSNTVIALTCDGSIQRSVDGGQSWSWGYSDNDHVNVDVAFADEKVGITVGRYGRILRTTDGGASWTIITPPAALAWGEHIYRPWFVSSTTGFWISDGGIYRTTDAGLTWTLDNRRGAYLLYLAAKTASGTSVVIGKSGVMMSRTELE